jgi:uncharacterized membrane protein YphA (DoxX/SURF4 family)
MPWTAQHKIWFRCCCLFFVLYIFCNPNGFFPFTDDAFAFYIRPFYHLIPWIEQHVLHIRPIPVTGPNGSGDTTFDYVMLGLILVLTLFGCIIWTLADRHRNDYNKLYYWLTVIVRYYFAFTMFNYGFAKLFKTQFPYPSPYTLQEPYGNSSPMRLAWTFFGYSRGYNYFMALAEIGSGALLLFRRTLRIGALVSLITAANIMAVNYSFDVCVKLLSTILVVMALFLLLIDWRRHANFYFLNKHVIPHGNPMPVLRRRWMNISLVVLKYLVIASVVVANVYGSLTALKDPYFNPQKIPLYGLYNVQTFVRNKDTLMPLITDTSRWRSLTIGYNGRTAVRLMNDSIRIYSFLPDTAKKEILVYRPADTLHKSRLYYSFTGKDSLLIRGKLLEDSVSISFLKFDLNKLLLINRGFHFINETPYNK